MTDDFLDCPSSGSKREFLQVHARVTRCPDSGDGCPEWFCAACGAALLIRLPPARRELTAASARHAAGLLDRVA
jgi:hypothetical protein